MLLGFRQRCTVEAGVTDGTWCLADTTAVVVTVAAVIVFLQPKNVKENPNPKCHHVGTVVYLHFTEMSVSTRHTETW